MTAAETPALSVVVPVRNEADNIRPLIEEIGTALRGVDPALPGGFEIIYVDDGSDDETPRRLVEMQAEEPALRILTHRRSCGQSAAIRSGVLVARADWVATLDGDGQNDPADLPALIGRLAGEGTGPGRGFTPAWGAAGMPFGMVAGQRTRRQDSRVRLWSSRIANGVRSRMLGDATPDTGCGLKLFARRAYLDLAFFDHMHRFLPALMRREGYAVALMGVGHRARTRGRSKYGIHNRLWVGIVDLVGMLWLNHRHRRPEIVDGPGAR